MRVASIMLVLAGAMLWLGCSGEAQGRSVNRSGARPRTVVLELFTSQGCSSCPPADRLLSRLRNEEVGGAKVIPLAYHVDYWDHLGWSDPFSSPRWSQRQREYAQVAKSSQVYTPQIVVNGTASLVGSAERQIRTEIEKQLQGSDRGTVSIERLVRTAGAARVDVRVHLDALQGAVPARVVVVLFENGVTTAVLRGENARSRMVNDAIVRWQGEAGLVSPNGTEVAASVTIPLAPGWRADHLGVATFLQDPPSLAIFGGASQPLPATAEGR